MGVASHEAKVVNTRSLDANRSPGMRLAPLSLALKGGHVADRHRDEIFLANPGVMYRSTSTPGYVLARRRGNGSSLRSARVV